MNKDHDHPELFIDLGRTVLIRWLASCQSVAVRRHGSRPVAVLHSGLSATASMFVPLCIGCVVRVTCMYPTIDISGFFYSM